LRGRSQGVDESTEGKSTSAVGDAGISLWKGKPPAKANRVISRHTWIRHGVQPPESAAAVVDTLKEATIRKQRAGGVDSSRKSRNFEALTSSQCASALRLQVSRIPD